MKQKTLHILALTLLTTSWSCVNNEVTFDDINLTPQPLPYEVNITGFITTRLEPVVVRVTKPGPLADSIQFEPVSDAVVRLYENGILMNELLPATQSDLYTNPEGLYVSADSIAGTGGSSYTLVVEVGDKEYTATDILPPPSTTFDLPPIRVNFNIGDSLFYIEWAKHNFGFDNPSMWMGISGLFGGGANFSVLGSLRSGVIYNHPGTIPQGVFPNGKLAMGIDTYPNREFDAYKLTISERYYEYLAAKFSETDWQAGIFSTIPANVPSNVEGGGTGFFWAASVTHFTTTLNELLE